MDQQGLKPGERREFEALSLPVGAWECLYPEPIIWVWVQAVDKRIETDLSDDRIVKIVTSSIPITHQDQKTESGHDLAIVINSSIHHWKKWRSGGTEEYSARRLSKFVAWCFTRPKFNDELDQRFTSLRDWGNFHQGRTPENPKKWPLPLRNLLEQKIRLMHKLINWCKTFPDVPEHDQPETFAIESIPVVNSTAPAPEKLSTLPLIPSLLVEDYSFEKHLVVTNPKRSDAELAKAGEAKRLFEDGEFSTGVSIVRDPLPANLWIVGDLHGDRIALAAVRALAEAKGGSPHFVFLGDYVDRGPDSIGIVRDLFDLLLDAPGRVALLGGNHDIELTYDAATDRFQSGVSPSEYVDALNALPSNDSDRTLGKVASELFRKLPRALILPNGTLLTHGGFPHTDLQPGIVTVQALQDNDMLQDFTWLRLAENAPERYPNRTTRGASFGYEDWNAFVAKMGSINVPIRRMIRGHDHVPERAVLAKRYRPHAVLTMNTMHRIEGDYGSDPVWPAVAWYGPGVPDDSLPTIYRLRGTGGRS